MDAGNATLLAVATIGVGLASYYMYSKQKKGSDDKVYERKQSYYEHVKASLMTQFDNQLKRLVTITSAEEWCDFYDKILSTDIQLFKVVGLDCEWIQKRGKRKPISMLQLSTINHTVLVRMHLLELIPASLEELLCNRSILKVGVAVLDDAAKLRSDYFVDVKGCVELRHLAFRFKKTWSTGLSLKKLAEELCDMTLDKLDELRCGNWESPSLSHQQLEYAARDSQASLAVFICLVVLKSEYSDSVVGVKALDDLTWLEPIRRRAPPLCQGLIDQPYKMSKKMARSQTASCDLKSNFHSAGMRSGINKTPSTSTLPLRKKIMYSNCFMQAPDGQLLCVCDAKKAQWYCDKGLADIVSRPGEDGKDMVIQLRFEPRGRPSGENDYYRSKKKNICVVCGADKSLIRKNIVPREYRKHFPEILKSHSSHDVVLLCARCHKKCSIYEQRFKTYLAELCDAPYKTEVAVTDEDLQRVKSAARALNGHKRSLPEDKASECFDRVAQYFGVDKVTDEHIKIACNLDTRERDPVSKHGKTVVKYYTQSSTMQEFQKIWREKFVENMQPQYMGEHWQLDYNHMDYLWKKKPDS